MIEVAQHRDLRKGLVQDQRGRHQYFIFMSLSGVFQYIYGLDFVGPFDVFLTEPS